MNIIAIDLGGTKVAAAIFDEKGNCFHKKKEIIPTEKAGADIGKIILKLVSDLRDKLNAEDKNVDSIGISIPGIFNKQTRTVWAPNIRDWDQYPLESEMEKFLNDDTVSISIENDRVCYLNGEIWKGNAQKCTDVIFLAVGTGIGAGIMSGGKFICGKNDISGSVGWMGLTPEFDDRFKQKGYFEYYGSGDGLVNLTQKVISEKNIQDDFFSHFEFRSEDIFCYYQMGNKVAKLVIEEAVRLWGMATANLVSIFNPEKIVFGGGVFGPASELLDEIRLEAQKWAQPISMKQVQLTVSTLGSDAGLFGAGKFAVDKFNQV